MPEFNRLWLRDWLPRFSPGRFYRRHLDPNRMTSKVVVMGGATWRVTEQRGKIIGIERWIRSLEVCGGVDMVYGYTCWKV